MSHSLRSWSRSQLRILDCFSCLQTFFLRGPTFQHQRPWPAPFLPGVISSSSSSQTLVLISSVFYFSGCNFPWAGEKITASILQFSPALELDTRIHFLMTFQNHKSSEQLLPVSGELLLGILALLKAFFFSVGGFCLAEPAPELLPFGDRRKKTQPERHAPA